MARKKKSKIQPFVIKIIFIVLVVGGLCYFVGNRTIHLFQHSDYFKIQSVVIDPALQFINKRDLRSLMGKNIFTVDLKAAQRRLSYKYPQAARLKVTKRFPNQILVVAKQRLPFGQIQVGGKIAAIDEEGVILSLEEKSAEDLTVISGIRFNDPKLVLGLPLAGDNIWLGLKVIKLFKANTSLKPYSIIEIDLGNLSKINLTLSNQLNVIIDRDKVAQKMRVLGVVLSQGKLDLKDVKYVDLRFKEPIIGKKQ